MNADILAISDLIAGYGEKKVIDRICLNIREKSFVGIIGPNGSGKSTFIQVLARYLNPESGIILLNKENLDKLAFRDFGKQVGFVPQENEIPFAYTVYDIIMMGRNPHIPRFRQPSVKDHEIVKQALKLTGTEHLADRAITTLSGGERQRVLIARVIAQDTDMLLLDEPFAHMDLHHQHELFRIMRDSTRGKKTVIGIFHDINLAATYCDELVVLYNGRVYASGTPKEILQRSLLEKIFNINPVVGNNPITGTPYIYVANPDIRDISDKKSIHLISGGGSGSPLISRFISMGYHVSCGVLSENDTDYMVAEMHGLHVITEPPFAGISRSSEELLIKQLNTADFIIVTGMPIGMGNYTNIRVLIGIPPEKIIFYIPDPDIQMPDYTGGEAKRLLSELIKQGVAIAGDINEIEEIINIKSGTCNQQNSDSDLQICR